MPNMLDYIAWRGDLTLKQDPLNENDELVLSQLSYIAFCDIVPGMDALPESISVREAAGRLLALDPEAEKIHQTGYMWKNNRALLAALQASARYGDMQLFGYADDLSRKDEKQFAAITIAPGNGTAVLAFRGTDDSLIGWKEDLNMALLSPVPAQLEAVAYLEAIADITDCPLHLSGHSKGGNLAVYAAACCQERTQDRLHAVVSHDGPGQSLETIESPGYARVKQKIRAYIPHFSVVGMLLEHEDAYTVVQSDAKTILQHDAFSWQMQGRHMLCADRPSEQSISTNRILRRWMDTLSAEEQSLFIEAVYEVASEAYGEKLPEDVDTNWSQNAQAVFTAMRKLEPETRSLFRKGLGDLFSAAIKTIRFPWHKEESAPEAETQGV